MGCDIHLWTEVQSDVTGKWEPRIEPKPNQWAEGGMEWPQDFTFRGYSLFAILADVRNEGPGSIESLLQSAGFSQIHNDRIEPISAPRGVPNDASANYEREVEDYGADGHSHSYFTLHELLIFDWNQSSATRRAYMRPQNSDVLKGRSLDEWAVGIQRLFQSYGSDAWKYTGNWGGVDMFQGSSQVDNACAIEWSPTYAQNSTEFLQYLLDLCRYAAVNGIPATDIRLVFFFDN